VDALPAMQTFVVVVAELVALFLVVLTGVALLQQRLGDERIERLLSSPRPLVGLIKGAALGGVTPFCSCSTIPIVLGLVRARVRFGTVAAFLLASPLLNPIILGAIGVLFGWRLALGYAVVAFATTVLLAAAWERMGFERFVKRLRVVRPGESDEGTPAEAGGTLIRQQTWRGLRTELRPAFAQALTALRTMAVPLLVGVAVGAAIYGVVPSAWLQAVLGPNNPFAIPLAAIVGIPLYVRAEIALPIGLALQEAGVGLGPVFALVIGGAGASIPEVSMLTAIFKPRLVAAFVVSVITVAIVGGLLIPHFA
jgi:uncharacterized protein